jgi:thiamine biosynthesis lipoprotein
MRISFKSYFFLVGAFLLLLAACQTQVQIHRQQFYVFGTLVEITIAGADKDTAEEATNHIVEQFQQFHDLWHAWQPGALQDINQAFANGESVSLDDPQLRDLILRAQDLATRTRHLFNPAIGKLSALWGFHNDDLPQGALPASADIERLVAANPNMDDVHIEGDAMRSDNPAVHLDFGAIAKGYAVDWAVAELKQRGIASAIVNAGGNLRAYGQRGERPWRIGIRHPSGQGVLAAVNIEGDESVFTSGNYERYHEFEGMRYSHILDPRTGWPVENMVSVTVIHDNGTVADAASTALSVAGLEAWRDIAANLGIDRVMLVDRQGKVYLTAAMQARVTFMETPPELIVLETL